MDRLATPFGELLKRHRLASGISQESLAERARISAAAVSALERGARRAPYRETVTLLAGALGLTVADQRELEAAAEQARGRQPRADDELPPEHNLPTRLTSFVGRGDEIAELKELLVEHRLVTVTGSGGVGKTRIAVETARQLLGEQFREARFVDLAPLEAGTFVASALAAALGIPPPESGEPLRTLASLLKTRNVLLILDNCEHVIDDAAAAAGAILRGCPGISIIATSRERLAIEGEHVYRLPSLPVPVGVPATIEEACTYAAFRFFMERASSSSGFSLAATSLGAIADICQRLEGIPLALELAATRLPALGLDALNDRLKGHFLTTSGARDLPQRQQTMLATIAWSYELLSPQEQILLRRLAVFRGGVTLEAAAAVCIDETVAVDHVPDLMGLLVDKSLLHPTLGVRRRYAMLESVREFASGKLREAEEFDSVARGHAIWLATLADRAHELLFEIPRGRFFSEFEPELDNVRSALEWCLNSDAETDVVVGARIVGGLRVLWLQRFNYKECLAWSTSILSRLDIGRNAVVAARVMRAEVQSSRGAAAKLEAGKRAIPIFEQIDDRQGLMLLYATLANNYGQLSAFNEAEQFMAKAFALADQEKRQQSFDYVMLLEIRCELHVRAGRLKEARADLAHAARVRRTTPEVDDMYFPLLREGAIELLEGNAQRSVELFEASLAQREISNVKAFDARYGLCVAQLALGNIEAAGRAARETLESSRDEFRLFWSAILPLAAVAAVRGHPRAAAHLFGFAEAQTDVGRFGMSRVCHDILMRSLHEQLLREVVEELMAEGAQLDPDRAMLECLSLQEALNL